MESDELPQVRLECFDGACARKVVAFCEQVPENRRGRNSAVRDGSAVVIRYTNKLWPYDIAEMAQAENLAGDSQCAAVYACL